MDRCSVEVEVKLCSGCGRSMFRVNYEDSEGDGYVVTRSIGMVCAVCDWMMLWPRVMDSPATLALVRSEAGDSKLYPTP